jgi:peptide chain release factor 2
LRAWKRASASSGGVFDFEGLRARGRELEVEAGRPDLWEDREQAERVLREKRALERELAGFDALTEAIEEAGVLLELAAEADDAGTLGEAAAKLASAESALEDAELRRLLGGEHDASNAILSINAGAGGTDACDWAEMLLRMYLRWAERRGFKTEILDVQAGDEAGIRGATVNLIGDHAYGYARTEQGVHRLVRISPFDSQHRRHTAFASVAVFPEIPDDVEIEIDDKDIRIDTYRAGGAGGQHVNKTDSAVRLTHFPSGIVVQCQNERSQHKNKAAAMKVLRARLFELRQREKEEQMEALRGEKREIGFGSQIRSYTLHPAQRIKDHRTKLEVSDTEGVLDGDLDAFIRATLLHNAAGAGPRP